MTSLPAFEHLTHNFNRAVELGFRFCHESDGRISVGIQHDHPNWEKYGFAENNKLMYGLASLEEALLWIDGFEACRMYTGLAASKDTQKSCSGNEEEGHWQ